MVEKVKFRLKRRAVSPVIAVVLIIALTVATAGVVLLVTNNLSQTTSNIEVIDLQNIVDWNGDGKIDQLTLKVKNTGDTVTLSSVLISTPSDFKGWYLASDYGVKLESQESTTIHIYANQSSDQVSIGETVDIGIGKDLKSLSFSEVRIQGNQGTAQPVKVSVATASKPTPSVSVDSVGETGLTSSMNAANNPVAGTSVTFVRKDGLPSGVTGLTTNANGEVSVYLLPAYYKIRLGSGLESKYFHSAENRSIVFADIVKAITVKIIDGNNAPISGTTVYVTDKGRNDVGTSGTTNASGMVKFNLGTGVYYFRVNYLGVDYFSSQISVPIPTGSTTTRTINIGNSGLSGTAVFGSSPVGYRRLLRLFTENNVSMGRYVYTNTTSGFSFTGIPSGFYRLRLDYGGRVFWSSIISTSDPTSLVNFGGGNMYVNISVGGSSLPNNVLVRLFTATQRYVGAWTRINSTGWANFGAQPKGDYVIRIDWLGKYTFTSNFTHKDESPVTVTASGGQLYIKVTANGTALPNRVLTRLFTDTGRYTGRWTRLNATGWAYFGTILEGTYKLRIDWLGRLVFTGNFTHVDDSPKSADVNGAPLIAYVTIGGDPAPNRVLVRLFNPDGRYTGLWTRVNATGYASFGIVFTGQYKIRLDWLGRYVLSSTFNHTDSSAKTVNFAGGNLFVKVNVGNMTPPQNILVRLFNPNNRYTGKWARTNSTGIVDFGATLNGTFKIRVDWLGKYVLSTAFIHMNSSLKTVNLAGGNLTIALTVGGYPAPNRVLTRLFNPDGRYTGSWARTNATGYNAYGAILAGNYMLRIDWMGQYVYTDVFVHANNTVKVVNTPGGNFTIGVTIGSSPIHDRVLFRLFDNNGRYTGRWAYTSGGNGTLAIGIALNGTYKLRADYMGMYTYSSTFYFNGAFQTVNYQGYPTLTIKVVDGNNGNSLFATNTRIYLFTSTGGYTGKSALTNSTGWISYTDVLNGTFKFRVGGSTYSNAVQIKQGITVAIPGGILLGMSTDASGGIMVLPKRGD